MVQQKQATKQDKDTEEQSNVTRPKSTGKNHLVLNNGVKLILLSMKVTIKSRKSGFIDSGCDYISNLEVKISKFRL